MPTQTAVCYKGSKSNSSINNPLFNVAFEDWWGSGMSKKLASCFPFCCCKSCTCNNAWFFARLKQALTSLHWVCKQCLKSSDNSNENHSQSWPGHRGSQKTKITTNSCRSWDPEHWNVASCKHVIHSSSLSNNPLTRKAALNLGYKCPSTFRRSSND